MISLSERIVNLPHSPTLWANDLVLGKRADGETIYHMGFGESPFPVPRLLEAALGDAAMHCEYIQAEGLNDLLQAAQAYYQPILGDDYLDESDLVVAPGSKLILYALQMAIEGDVLLPVPSWVSYAPQAAMLNCAVVPVESDLSEKGMVIDAHKLASTIELARAQGKNPTKIVLNSPNNPTGLCIPRDNLLEIAAVCRQQDIFVISDEIYGFVNFDHEYNSIAPMLPANTAVTTGLSKHLSLGGWRLGIGFIPRGVEGLYHAMKCIISETWSCVPSPIQRACVQAYQRHDEIEWHIADCARIHGHINQMISVRLADMGLQTPLAQGAFYNYPNFAQYSSVLAQHGIDSSVTLQQKLLEEFNVATLPGSAFGEQAGTLTLRLSGCDYDGKVALAALQSGHPLDDEFITRFAPQVLDGIAAIERFIERYGREGGA